MASKPKKTTSRLVCCTSSEILGKRSLPHALRGDDLIAFVTGPEGSGRSSVGLRIAGDLGVKVLGQRATSNAIEACIAAGREGWSNKVLGPSTLVIDGPGYLRKRTGRFKCLMSLILARQEKGKRTIIVQHQEDSIHKLYDELDTGTYTIVRLRWPKGIRGRRRFVNRLCDQRGIPKIDAKHLCTTEPWGYKAVLKWFDGHEA